jgi:hypothetical protein
MRLDAKQNNDWIQHPHSRGDILSSNERIDHE